MGNQTSFLLGVAAFITWMAITLQVTCGKKYKKNARIWFGVTVAVITLLIIFGEKMKNLLVY